MIHTVSVDCKSSQSNRVAKRPEVFVPLDAFLLYMALRGRVWDAEWRPFFILGKGGKDILTIIEHLPYSDLKTMLILGETKYAEI